MTTAILLRPFISFLLLWLVVRPLARWCWRVIPPGRIKRFLFISWKV